MNDPYQEDEELDVSAAEEEGLGGELSNGDDLTEATDSVEDLAAQEAKSDDEDDEEAY